MNSENLHTSGLIRNSDVDFSVETSSTTEGRVDGIRSVCGTDNDDLTTALGTVHKSKHLSDHTLLDFTLGFLSVGSD